MSTADQLYVWTNSFTVVMCSFLLIYTWYEQYISSGIKCQFHWRYRTFHIFVYFLFCLFIFVLCATYFLSLFCTSGFCSNRSMWPPYSCVCTFHTNTSTVDKSHVRLLRRSLYRVNGTLYYRNLSGIEVWTSKGNCAWSVSVKRNGSI